LQRNVFNNIASIYDEALPSHISRHYLEKRVDFFSRYLRPNFKILDVGCGTGKIIVKLSENSNLKVYGCDSSLEMLKNISNRSNLQITCCLSDRLPYMVDTFDLIISVAVFHHLSSKEVALRTIHDMIRVVKKGGRIIIWDANPWNPYWQLLFKRVLHDKDVKKILPLKKIIYELKKLNLTDITIFKSGWVPDFAPKNLSYFFNLFEYIMERLPIIKLFSAHNVIVFTK